MEYEIKTKNARRIRVTFFATDVRTFYSGFLSLRERRALNFSEINASVGGREESKRGIEHEEGMIPGMPRRRNGTKRERGVGDSSNEG